MMVNSILAGALAACGGCQANSGGAGGQQAPSPSASAIVEGATPATADATLTNAGAAPADSEPSLVSLSAGAIIVKKPQEYGTYWSAVWILDERPKSGWATPKNVTSPQVIVIALPEQTVLYNLVFDTGGVDGDDGRGAKDIMVEVSDKSAAEGFQKIAEVSLQDKADNQRFPVSARLPGRWIRLTIKNNHGSQEYIELFDFRASGQQLTRTPAPNVSGTYASNYGAFHIRQQGTSVTGCYESGSGLVEGGVDGRVLTFSWREVTGKHGPAVVILSPDGNQMVGVWWHHDDVERAGGLWDGTRQSDDVGSCAHWAGGVKEQLAKDLEEFGRARIYGINFDTDSDRIKDESKPTLEQIVTLLKAKLQWKLTIEGHTDAQASAEHNQALSERRANAVKLYLQSAGIHAVRLKAVGYGFSKPVAPNDNPLGRAQNRRVELSKQ
jgi:outer membrane protein OmpA-like peptidoglycan-associated protein